MTPADTRRLDVTRIAVALDVDTLADVDRLAGILRPAGVTWFKVGLGLFCREGVRAVEAVQRHGGRVFLDLKLHDIPHQVGLAARAVSALGVELLTVHASGGAAMVAAAREHAGGAQVIAVTVLTSLEAPEGEVVRLAEAAVRAGADGIVCSPLEVAAVRVAVPTAFLVTPGVRPPGAELGDQQRVATPSAALAAGADLLVVGRPITGARDPVAGLRAVLES